MEKKYKSLGKNIGLFASANFGSKIIKFLLVSYYTYCLTTAEYGTADMFSTTVSLFTPVILLSLNDALLRYVMKPGMDRQSVVTNSFLVVTCMSVICLPGYFIFRYVQIFNGFWWLFYLTLISSSFQSLLSNLARAIGKSKVFAFGGILNTVILVISNIVLLSWLHLGISGYLWSIVISYIGCNLYYIARTKVWSYISLKRVQSTQIKMLLAYSLPLIPTAMMWWIMNASDRYVINFFLDVSCTGIYAVAHKLPTMITVLFQVFQQAWQLSAIEESENSDRSAFYSRIYGSLTVFLFIAVSGAMLLSKTAVRLVIASEYQEVWKYVPILLTSAVFSAFSGFLGVNYAISEKTKGALLTAGSSAIVNLILNIILTPLLGMYGTAMATMISFLMLWIIRSIDTKDKVGLKYNVRTLALSTVVVILQTVIATIGYVKLQLIFLVLLIIVNKTEIMNVYHTMVSCLTKLRRKR